MTSVIASDPLYAGYINTVIKKQKMRAFNDEGVLVSLHLFHNQNRLKIHQQFDLAPLEV